VDQELIIRQLNQQDKTDFINLVNEYIQEYIVTEKVFPVKFDPSIGQIYWESITDKPQDHRVVVAESKGRLCGFCIGEIHHYGKIEKVYFQGNQRGEIWDIFVSPQNRGLGIGENLIKKAEELFIESGCKDILLNEVGVDNLGAKKLYERIGYQPWNMRFYKKLG